MVGKVEQRRDALRRKLIDIAEERVAQGGIEAVKARDLAQAAECALGAIYNVFDDLHDIIIAVNGRTFGALGNHVAGRLEASGEPSPTGRLIVMAHAYLDYATEHPNTWRALFDIDMSTDTEVPEWYLAELSRLFGHIAGPVQQCFPDMDSEQVNLMTRALFSSVHGMVLLGLENRISAVPKENLKAMIALLIENATCPKK